MGKDSHEITHYKGTEHQEVKSYAAKDKTWIFDIADNKIEKSPIPGYVITLVQLYVFVFMILVVRIRRTIKNSEENDANYERRDG